MKTQMTTRDLGTRDFPSLEDALTELEMAGLEAEKLLTRRGTWRIVDTDGNRVGWLTQG